MLHWQVGGCQANNTDISRIKRSICVRRFPKGDAPNGCRKRSESSLVERWGKAPYPKFLFLEMFGLILTTPFYLQSERAEPAFISNAVCTALKSCSRRRVFTFPHTSIMIPRRSRGFFLDGRSPLLLATRHVALVRSDTCIGLLLAARKRAQLTQKFPIVSCSPALSSSN